MFSIRGVAASDADALFPMIHRQAVTDTIVWDGPADFAGYRAGLAEKEALHRNGEVHFFTIVAPDGSPAGTISFRPDNDYRGNIGLWVGEKYHGQGAGTQAVKAILNYAFGKPGFAKIEAAVFVGNTASRRIFEKNGFKLEGTIRAAVKKRGKLLDEWMLGITREDFTSWSSGR